MGGLVLSQFINRTNKARLNNLTPIIISDNCWAGSVYNFLDLPYYSPLIGTYVYPESFLELIKDFPENFIKPIAFTDRPKHPLRKDEPEYYPVGIIDGEIEIYFLHYKNEKEVLEKWQRRTERMLSVLNNNTPFFKMDDSNFATIADFTDFHSFSFGNKISFSKSKVIEIPEHFEIRLKDEWVSCKNTSYNFDVIHWLNTGGAKQTFINRIVRPIYDKAIYE